MSYYLQHREHGPLMAAAMADSRGEEDVFLVSSEGHRIYTAQLLLRLHSPLLSLLLDSLPSSPSCPGLSLPLLPASSLRHLLLLLQRGKSSSQSREELLAVEAAAVTLGVSLPNCVLVGKGARRKEREKELDPVVKQAVQVVPGLKISKVRSESVKEEKEQGPRKVVVDEVQQQKYRCKVCDFTAIQASDVREHGQAEHSGKVFECPKCKKRYSKKRVLKRHLEEKHSAEHGVSVKSEPGSEANSSMETKRPQGTPRNCEVCDKVFYNPASLKMHMNIHLDKKPFACEFCGWGFAQKGNMLSHAKKCSNNSEKTAINSSSVGWNEMDTSSVSVADGNVEVILDERDLSEEVHGAEHEPSEKVPEEEAEASEVMSEEEKEPKKTNESEEVEEVEGA